MAHSRVKRVGCSSAPISSFPQETEVEPIQRSAVHNNSVCNRRWLKAMLLWPLAIAIGIAMTLELKMLAFSIVLGLVHIVLASHAASLQRGYVWTASSRDKAVPALTGVAGRLARALQNFVETFPLFAAAVLIAHVTATHSSMTEWGVQLYFWGRVTYLALYAAGVFLLRSLVWNVASLGIVLVLLSLI